MQEERIKNLLERSTNVLIVPTYPNEPESLKASRWLFKILRHTGKNATLALDNQISSGGVKIKKVCLTINSFDRHVKQIYYEKDKKSINIFLDFFGHDISLEDIALKPLESEREIMHDLIITIGVPNLASLDDFLEENFKLFYEKPIINIDNSQANEGYGQVNLITEEQSLLEVVQNAFSFLNTQTTNTPAINDSPVIEPTNNNLADQTVSPVPLIKTLGEKNFGRIKLLARVLSSLEIDHEHNCSFFFAQNQDFLETKTNVKDLVPVIEHLTKQHLAKANNFILLWQEPTQTTSFSGLVYTDNQQHLARMSDQYTGALQGKGLLFSGKEATLKEAKAKITTLL